MATLLPSLQPSSRSRCAKAAATSRWLEGVPEPRKPMVGTFPLGWASAANGRLAATLPSSQMISRRFMLVSIMRAHRIGFNGCWKTSLCPSWGIRGLADQSAVLVLVLAMICWAITFRAEETPNAQIPLADGAIHSAVDRISVGFCAILSGATDSGDRPVHGGKCD